MKRLLAAGLAIGVLLTVAGPVAAGGSQFVRISRASSLNDCRAARVRHLLANSTPCPVTRTAWGQVRFRTYRTNPVITFEAPPPLASYAASGSGGCTWINYGCVTVPDPRGRYYYSDSFEVARGPVGLWQVSIKYHIKSNGITVVQTAAPTCDYFGVGVSITINSCEMVKRDTARGPVWEIGVRWRECFAHPIFGFCNTKGLTMTINGRSVLSRSTW